MEKALGQEQPDALDAWGVQVAKNADGNPVNLNQTLLNAMDAGQRDLGPR